LLPLAGGALIVIVAVAAVVLTRSGGHRDGGGTSLGRQTTTIALPAGDITAAGGGGNPSFTSDQADQVLSVIRTYVKQAVVKPMRSGGPAGDLSSVFDAPTLARVTGGDRPVMVQEGLPRITGKLKVASQPIALVALGDQTGKIVLVTAAIDLTADGRVAKVKVPLHVEQQGDLVLAPDATGAWKVTSYNMAVARSGGGIDVTTTVPAPTNKVSK
jgi:hypothetical protein